MIVARKGKGKTKEGSEFIEFACFTGKLQKFVKLTRQTRTQSEPPCGSGWVRSLFRFGAYGVPTRYREVVLTVSKKRKIDN